MALHLEIVTPERKVFSDTVDNVYLPGTDGEMGILESHAALVSALDAGELRYAKGGEVVELAIGHGFAEVTQEKVTVLTDVAFAEDQIDEDKVAEALERAQKTLEEIDPKEAEEHAAQQKVIASAMAQLALKRKRRNSSN
ncbi:ATP synthase F1 subunit epsilon [Roseibacillus ishigakijimensis]|uniref:ATP synthase epsilon chain n=1 Tax=Roseibacillus ishigakijimensis TaxID=454146 RepID=A0A934RMH6_9BACT|nr:ATP synthase F1 subunit epsilon [Roseibacillus ishigakijimensis]MBK1834517.1 ATP synthase F1 subunit epsilon [Roseibacillus ishigakijimensis]